MGSIFFLGVLVIVVGLFCAGVCFFLFTSCPSSLGFAGKTSVFSK